MPGTLCTLLLCLSRVLDWNLYNLLMQNLLRTVKLSRCLQMSTALGCGPDYDC